MSKDWLLTLKEVEGILIEGKYPASPMFGDLEPYLKAQLAKAEPLIRREERERILAESQGTTVKQINRGKASYMETCYIIPGKALKGESK